MSLHFSGMFLSARGGEFEVDRSYFVCVGHVVSGREWVLGSHGLFMTMTQKTSHFVDGGQISQ